MQRSRRQFLVALACVALAAGGALAADAKVHDIAIKGGKVVGANTLRVTQGDMVVLRWTSDRPIDLHLHGYDVEAKVAPGKPAEMKVNARATGRFPVEVHTHDKSGSGHGHSALFYLEVYPK
jgi:hypothetical protein